MRGLVGQMMVDNLRPKMIIKEGERERETETETEKENATSTKIINYCLIFVSIPFFVKVTGF